MEAASIGIIGGADGPTAVYIASRLNWPVILAVLFSAALLISAAFAICKRK